MLQLLRAGDLAAARAKYAANQVPGAAAARARHPRAPGALALLLANKLRLRRLGAAALQRLLDESLAAAEEEAEPVERGGGDDRLGLGS